MKIKNFKQLSIYIFLFLIQFAIFAQEQNSSETNSTGSSLSKEQAAEILKKHNEFRKKTSSSIPDLTWSTEISTYSQKWAEHLKLTKKCGLEHRKGKKKVHKYGENLFAMYGASASPEKVVTAWYDEVKDYTYSTNSCNLEKYVDIIHKSFGQNQLA